MNPLFGSILIHRSLSINHLAATFFLSHHRNSPLRFDLLLFLDIYLAVFCIVHTALLPTPLLASNFSYFINKLSSAVWLSTPNMLLSSGSMAADSHLMFSSLPLLSIPLCSLALSLSCSLVLLLSCSLALLFSHSFSCSLALSLSRSLALSLSRSLAFSLSRFLALLLSCTLTLSLSRSLALSLSCSVLNQYPILNVRYTIFLKYGTK